MTSAEITRDIICAMVGSQHTAMYGDKDSAVSVAEAYEIIYDKVVEMSNKSY